MDWDTYCQDKTEETKEKLPTVSFSPQYALSGDATRTTAGKTAITPLIYDQVTFILDKSLLNTETNPNIIFSRSNAR
jgi:hypothetical protein